MIAYFKKQKSEVVRAHMHVLKFMYAVLSGLCDVFEVRISLNGKYGLWIKGLFI